MCVNGEATCEQALQGGVHGGHRSATAVHKVGQPVRYPTEGVAALACVDVDQLRLQGACR